MMVTTMMADSLECEVALFSAALQAGHVAVHCQHVPKTHHHHVEGGDLDEDDDHVPVIIIIMRIRIESHRLRSLENLKVAGHCSQLTFTCHQSCQSHLILSKWRGFFLSKNADDGGDNDDDY